MSKIGFVKRDHFNLESVRISDDGLEVAFTETGFENGQPKGIPHTIKAPFQPHPDLIAFRDDLKQYLVKAYALDSVFHEAEKYLKGEQKSKVSDKLLAITRKIEVTKISIGGTDQLEGCVISGKMESFNGAKLALNTPRIVYSSDKLGFEKEAMKTIELIGIEVYKYLYEGKRALADLFDGQQDAQDQAWEALAPKDEAQDEPVTQE